MGSILNKEAYDYASKEDGHKGTAQRRADNLRREASKLLEDELSKRTPQYSARTGNEGTMGRVRAERENSRGSAQEAQNPDPVRLTQYTFQKNIAQPYRRNSQALATLVPSEIDLK